MDLGSIFTISTDSAVVAKKATMAKSAIAEKGHLYMETRLLCLLDYLFCGQKGGFKH